MSNVKDWLTNIIGIVLVVAGAVNVYIQSLGGSGNINWWQLIVTIGGALIAYFTGKNGDGTAKITPNVNPPVSSQAQPPATVSK